MLGQVRERSEVALEARPHVVAVRSDDPIMLCSPNLDGTEVLVSPSSTKLALTGSPKVAHPVGLPAAANEVPLALEIKGGRAASLSGDRFVDLER